MYNIWVKFSQTSRLPGRISRRLVEEFGSLDALTRASVKSDPGARPRGTGKTRARTITRGLQRSSLRLPPSSFSEPTQM
jgi:DNA integrity scanning protein DisA with diadenylate cyclase activity